MLDDDGAMPGALVLWHVALTVSGPAVCMDELRFALDRLVQPDDAGAADALFE